MEAVDNLKLSDSRLSEMHEDLLKFISENVAEKQLKVKNTQIIIPKYKKSVKKRYNTLVVSELPLDQKCNLYVNLDASYGYSDIYALGKQCAVFIEHQMKKDAFHFGTIAKMLYKKHKNMLPGNVYQLAVREFLKFKDTIK